MTYVSFMIDPSKITNFNRSPEELEEFLLFAIVVAGKNAYQQAKKLEEFLSLTKFGYTPFGVIRTMDMDDSLDFFLKKVKMGQYQRISSAFRGVAKYFRHNPNNERFHPLQEVKVKHLECFKGIGMKTSRFFVMHSRRNNAYDYACLDTHILRWLGCKGHEVPNTTPSGTKYLELEKLFLDYAKDMNIMPAALDLQIWNEAQASKVEKSKKPR